MNIDFFLGLSPVLQAFIATLFTWFMTALGSGLVFFFRTINRKVLDAMLGFAAGVMIAASYWSLLALLLMGNAIVPFRDRRNRATL